MINDSYTFIIENDSVNHQLGVGVVSVDFDNFIFINHFDIYGNPLILKNERNVKSLINSYILINNINITEAFIKIYDKAHNLIKNILIKLT